MPSFGSIPNNQDIAVLPAGGATNEVLKKTASTDYAVAWGAASGGGAVTRYDWFGTGEDLDVVISSNTTLTRDWNYSNLTVNAGVTLVTAGYRIFVRNTLTVIATGVIHNDGANATGTTVAGVGGMQSVLPGGQGGGNGQAAAGGVGGSVTTGAAINANPAGGKGGNGSGGAGGAASTSTVNDAYGSCVALPMRITLQFQTNGSGTLQMVQGGASGGSGGGDGTNRGGASGGGGGNVVIAARLIVNNGAIRSHGGAGFSVNASTGTNLGGGGGSQGGNLFITTTTGGLTGSGTTTVTGGAGGLGKGTGTAGNPGADGKLSIMEI